MVLIYAKKGIGNLSHDPYFCAVFNECRFSLARSQINTLIRYE